MEFITLLSDHPQYAGPVIIVLMMLESAPVTGFFLPGTFILPLLGAMAVSSHSAFWYLFSCAVAGAFSGDLLGFWLGRVSAHKWLPHAVSRHRQRTAERAHELISRHGLLAIFSGRFIWFIHPAIPGAAGLLGVELYRFILFDLPAVFLWVLFYMGGGQQLAGWFSQTFELVETLALVLVVLLLLWCLRYAIYHLLRRNQKHLAGQLRDR
ncbi:MAG TPA: DedA family protein [Gammaproteobacteria bacterium]|nr:DedA family protein [Gammaproteobacteria bacterium]